MICIFDVTGQTPSDRNDDLAAARKQSMETARRELDPATILQVRTNIHMSIHVLYVVMAAIEMAVMSAAS